MTATASISALLTPLTLAWTSDRLTDFCGMRFLVSYA